MIHNTKESKRDQSMDEYIDQLIAEFEALTAVVKNILDEPIPEVVKSRLLKPLRPSVFEQINTS